MEGNIQPRNWSSGSSSHRNSMKNGKSPRVTRGTMTSLLLFSLLCVSALFQPTQGIKCKCSGTCSECETRGSCRAEYTKNTAFIQDQEPPHPQAKECVRFASTQFSEIKIKGDQILKGSYVVCRKGDNCNESPLSFIKNHSKLWTPAPVIPTPVNSTATPSPPESIQCACSEMYKDSPLTDCEDCNFCIRNTSIFPPLIDHHLCDKTTQVDELHDFDWKLEMSRWHFLLTCRNKDKCNTDEPWPYGFPDKGIPEPTTTTTTTTSTTTTTPTTTLSTTKTPTTTPKTTPTTLTSTSITISSTTSSAIPPTTVTPWTEEDTHPTPSSAENSSLSSTSPPLKPSHLPRTTPETEETKSKGIVETIVVVSFVFLLIIAFVIVFIIIRTRMKKKKEKDGEASETEGDGGEGDDDDDDHQNEGETEESKIQEKDDSQNAKEKEDDHPASQNEETSKTQSNAEN